MGKYDGKKVGEYRNIRSDSTNLSNNLLADFYEDSKERILSTTKNELNCYFPESDSFVQYINYEGENFALSVVEDQRGFIWYST